MKRLLEWLELNKGNVFQSPREKLFGKITLRFLINKVTDDNVQLKFLPSGTPLSIELWRLEESMNFLLESRSAVRVGARLKTKWGSSPHLSLEEHLNKIAMKRYSRESDTKTAPHICDLFVLSGIAEYVPTESDTGRKVQGIKLL